MAGFSIFPRKRKSGKPVFYVQFKKSDGSYDTAKSTGQTSRRAAEQWAENYLNTHGVPLPGRNVTLKHYSKNFFAWTGPWATDKRVRGLRLSERWCNELNRLLEKKIIPEVGDYSLTAIDENIIEQLRNGLFNEGFKGSYINKVLIALTAILTRAKKEKLIKHLPDIDKAGLNTRQKGILAISEVQKLFSEAHWSDYRGRVGNLMAAVTGLRLSELLALTFSCLHLQEGYLSISRAWDSKLRRFNLTTKNGRDRNLIIPDRLKKEIFRLMEKNPHKNVSADSFLFFSERVDRPVDEKLLSRSFYAALGQIGISAQQRKERAISFHSHRHFFNSLLINAKVPLQKVQSMTGHLTAEMSQHYYHLDDMEDVLKIQEGLFSGGHDE